VQTSDFDYNLPQDRIAQTPISPRHKSRLMVVNRADESIKHSTFWHIDQFLRPGDLLVINETKVIPARIYARKRPGGGRVELLLLKQQGTHTWTALVGGKGLITGRELTIKDGPDVEIVKELAGPKRLIQFSDPIELYIDHVGKMPLPPYIHKTLEDSDRYQTVYAKSPGSVAAPTAGLHFTPELMDKLSGQGVGFTRITLHVGLDTFAPVTESDPAEHEIHTEWCELAENAAETICAVQKAGGRIIAVGTTSVRTLETAAQTANESQVVMQYSGSTGLFILPGYRFRAVDALVTNFHLPKSTLLMLVSAFANRDIILNAYQQAVDEKYRFYSFGDAMLIL